MLPLIVALGFVAAAVSVALDRQQVSQVDAQLRGSAQLSLRLGQDEPPPSGPIGSSNNVPEPPFLSHHGQGPGTLGAQFENGIAIYAAVVNDTGGFVGLTTEQLSSLRELPVGGNPQTVHLGENLGDYRVIAESLASDEFLVVGAPLAYAQSTVDRLMLVELVVSSIAVILAAAIGLLLINRALYPLKRLSNIVTRASMLPLASGEVPAVERVSSSDTDPRTEVGRVGAAFNLLLGHVEKSLTARQASEVQSRKFIADASHELRTPLASIRGYAELTRRGNNVPEDVARALLPLESEALRMSRLVDDMLLLARIDAKQDMSMTKVDLTTVVVESVIDAQLAGADHVWHLELPPYEVSIIGDDNKLRRAINIVLSNVRVHTPAGTICTVEMKVGDSGAIIAVGDNGPGIAADLQKTIFDRFARGDASRSRKAGGTGLALAIARAVVEAHGGSISLESSTGSTRFTANFPSAVISDEQPAHH